MKRIPKGSKEGGRFAPDPKSPPPASDGVIAQIRTSNTDRRNPPVYLTVEEGRAGEMPFKLLISPDGEAYFKYYDEYGAGAVRIPLNFMQRRRYRKKIEKAIADAWESFDKIDQNPSIAQTYETFKNQRIDASETE